VIGSHVDSGVVVLFREHDDREDTGVKLDGDGGSANDGVDEVGFLDSLGLVGGGQEDLWGTNNACSDDACSARV
jgi:hypothetical protein